MTTATSSVPTVAGTAVDDQHLAAAHQLSMSTLHRVAQDLVERLHAAAADLVVRRVELGRCLGRRLAQVARELAPEERRRVGEARVGIERLHHPLAERGLGRDQQPVHVPQRRLTLDRAGPAGADSGLRRLAQVAVGGPADVALHVHVAERLDDLVGDHRRLPLGKQRVDAELGVLEIEVADRPTGRDHRQRLERVAGLGHKDDDRAVGVERVRSRRSGSITDVLPVFWPPISPSPSVLSPGRIPTGPCSSLRIACSSARLTSGGAGSRGTAERATRTTLQGGARQLPQPGQLDRGEHASSPARERVAHAAPQPAR